MGKYLLKVFYFSLPVLAVFLFIVVIDPYELVNISHLIGTQSKIAVLNRSDEASPRGNMLWKTIHFKREPKSKLIIGDSQGRKIKESIIKEVSGEDYFNYCCEGASYETMVDVFWFAASQVKLEKVVFQVGYANYSANRSYNLFHFGIDITDEPYRYFTTPDILADSYENLLFAITKNRSLVENSYEYQDPADLDSLSEFRLGLFFSDYEYPAKFYAELKKISDYCKDNNIQLSFLVLPVYDRVNEYLKDNGLEVVSPRFKGDMHRLGKTYDFELPSEMTGKRAKFIDYFHPKQPVLDKITREVWGKQNE